MESHGLASAGACHDQPAWDEDFAGRTRKCGFESAGRMPQAGVCMAREAGISSKCGNCIGEYIQCGASFCAVKCCLGSCVEEVECKQCIEDACSATLQTCSG